MDHNNNQKTWDLAKRARKVSKGQAKIFLTRNAGDEQRLAKLTHHLDKEKSAKNSELNFAQKLLVKRYGAGKAEFETVERGPLRNRSFTWDSTFMTKPEMDDTRNRTVSFDIICRKNSLTQSRGTLGDIPRARTSEKDLAPVRRFSHIARLQPRKDSHAFSLSDGEISKSCEAQETRPRAISEVLPPISLPPIYKADQSLPVGGGLRSRFSTTQLLPNTTKPVIGQVRKKSLGAYTTPENAILSEENSMKVDSSLVSCRYLRKRDNEGT